MEMNKDKALKLALEALEKEMDGGWSPDAKSHLRKALWLVTQLAEQPAQKEYKAFYDGKKWYSVEVEQPAQQQSTECVEPVVKKVGRITANVKDMVLRQEVMLYTDNYLPIGTAIYTTPPPRKPWMGLTDKELALLGAPWHFNLLVGEDRKLVLDYARAIEAKLKERNT